MILPDVNLLLFAINSDCPDHAKALAWWKRILVGNELIGLLPAVSFAFVRLSTNRKVFPEPLSVDEAFGYLENWLQFPNVSWVEMEAGDLQVAKRLLQAAGTGANLVTDAQIAAVALRLKAKVQTADADFGRFPGVKWSNPLA
jgi:uncharacterized protein